MNMSFQGLDTLIVAGTIALAAWALKETVKTLINTLIKTMAKVDMLDNKLNELNHAANEVPRLRSDVNDHNRRLIKIEDRST